MRRTFTLQMHDRPKGRAFTCPSCGAASMESSDAKPPVCLNCSPFLSVTTVDGGRITAVCRWATTPVVLLDYDQVLAWWSANLGIPHRVFTALKQHFDTSGVPISVVPPPVGLPVTQNEIITVQAARDLTAGQIVTAADVLPYKPVSTKYKPRGHRHENGVRCPIDGCVWGIDFSRGDPR